MAQNLLALVGEVVQGGRQSKFHQMFPNLVAMLSLKSLKSGSLKSRKWVLETSKTSKIPFNT